MKGNGTVAASAEADCPADATHAALEVEADFGGVGRADRYYARIWIATGAAEAVDGVDQDDD